MCDSFQCEAIDWVGKLNFIATYKTKRKITLYKIVFYTITLYKIVYTITLYTLFYNVKNTLYFLKTVDRNFLFVFFSFLFFFG